MSSGGSLIIVRHGQANFHGEDYDVLSDLGCEQGVRLGTWLARSGREVGSILSGPLKRQRDTTTAIREGAGAADVIFPNVTIDDAWTEYPAIALLKRGVPALAEADPEVRAMLGDSDDEPRSLAGIKDFERLFLHVQRAWMNGDLALDDIETFSDFKQRTADALDTAFEAVGDGRGIVVTSGGPVGMAMQLALGLTDEMAMRMTSVVANSAMTSLRRRDGGYLLTSFNALPHLRDPKLITFR